MKTRDTRLGTSSAQIRFGAVSAACSGLSARSGMLMGLLFGFLLMAGCTSPRIESALEDHPIGLSYHPANVFAVDHLPADLNRVLVLPLTDSQGNSMPEELAEAFFAELRRTARFEIIRATALEKNQISAASFDDSLESRTLSTSVLDEAKRYDADGVLQLRMTHFRAYKPIQMGVRARLIHLNAAGDVLWSIDELYDAGDTHVAIGARRYAERYIDQAYPLQSSYSVLGSPVRYASYVAATSFETLPPRQKR